MSPLDLTPDELLTTTRAVQQVCPSPLAHTIGTDFEPAVRPAPDSIIRWDNR